MKYVLPNRLTTEDKEEFKLYWKRAHSDMIAIIADLKLSPMAAFEMAASLWPPRLLDGPPAYAMTVEYLQVEGEMGDVHNRISSLRGELDRLEPGSPERGAVSLEIARLRADFTAIWQRLRSMHPENQK